MYHVRNLLPTYMCFGDIVSMAQLMKLNKRFIRCEIGNGKNVSRTFKVIYSVFF